MAAGAKGILITPSDPAGLADTVRRAREAGVLVIALDTPFDPIDSADITFATDNFLAGELIGKWAAATMGDTATAKIATLDLSESQITVDVLRNQGFLEGFGVDVKDVKKMYDEDDPRMVGGDVTAGSEEGGRTAMENLLQKDSVSLPRRVGPPLCLGKRRIRDGEQASQTGRDRHETTTGRGVAGPGNGSVGGGTSDRHDGADLSTAGVGSTAAWDGNSSDG